jgi:hypothetical protein
MTSGQGRWVRQLVAYLGTLPPTQQTAVLSRQQLLRLTHGTLPASCGSPAYWHAASITPHWTAAGFTAHYDKYAQRVHFTRQPAPSAPLPAAAGRVRRAVPGLSRWPGTRVSLTWRRSAGAADTPAWAGSTSQKRGTGQN